MAFVPEFEHDVFISYSQVDNEEVRYGAETAAWVRNLKDRLETRVRQRGIGRDLHVWMDTKDLSGNSALSSTLFEAVRRTAVLVIIFSENYLQSEWCKKERETFLEAAANDPRFDGRLFIVHYQEVPLDARPEALRDFIGFPFYDRANQSELDPRSDDFTRELLNLREKVASKLKEMRQSIEAGAATANASATATASSTASPAADDRPAVFLAEGTPDLYAARSQLQTFIDKLGYRVVPEKLYDRSAGEFRSAAAADMAQNCKLFVQWLGPFATFRTGDLPEGYEGLQLAVANDAQLPTLRAYQRGGVDFESVPDPAQRDFLRAADVMALDLEEFKKRIERTLVEIAQKEQLPGPGVAEMGESAGTDGGDADAQKSILITFCGDDRAAALRIKQQLAAANPSFGFEIVDRPDTFEQLTKFYQFDGLVVVFGTNSTEDEVADWMRRCAFHRLERSPLEPACAVYLDPGENRCKLLSDPPFFSKIVDEPGDEEFVGFVAEMKRGRQA